jgi:hypothetical protein
MRQSFATSVATLCVLLAACTSGEQGPGSGFARSDSAGVAIAMNDVNTSELEPVFTVTAEPTLSFGLESGAEELMFSGIRSAVRLDDGRIAVANGSPMEIRIFSPQGEFIKRLGGRGQGPGEFTSLSTLLPGRGDTLNALNMPYFQLLRFTVENGYVDMIAANSDSIRRHLGELSPAEGTREYFANGSVLTTGRVNTGGPTDGSQYPTGKLFRPVTTLVWVDRNYERSRTVGEFGQIQQMFIDVGDGMREPVVPPSARYQRRASGARGTRSCHAGNDEPEVRCIDDNGSILIVRWNQETLPTPQSDIEAWRENLRTRAAAPGSRTTPQAIERVISGVIIPPTRPLITSMLVDADGRIYVRGPDIESGTEGWLRYRVFSRDGELIGLADLPAVTIRELGADYLFGVSRNEDEIESVVVHGITRGGLEQ